MPEVTVAQTRIPYDVVRSPRRRTVAIEVQPDGRVVVRSPVRTPESRLRDFIVEKAPWITRHLREAARREADASPRIGELGATVTVLGQSLPLEVHLAPGLKRYRVERVGDVLRVVAPPGADQAATRDAVRQVLEAWYRAEGQRLVTERVAHYAAQLGVTPKSVRVKQQARRWGSCSAKGALNFNWRLAMAPPEIVDYVVAHEVAHLKVLSHSKKFWAVLATLYPTYEASRRWLRREGWRLTL